jgi:uncharacterized protein YjbI with pentapeptide repeats
MTHLARLLFLFLLLPALPRAHAQSDITLVTHTPAQLDPEALRSALESELQVSTVLRAEPSGPTLQVDAETLQAVKVSFLREGKPDVERTVDVSTQADHATGIVALLASNLVRDEASELLAQLSAARPVPAPAPEAPPPAAPRPFLNHACQPNKLKPRSIGADILPFLGTSMRDGTRVERRLSLNLFGGITGGVRGLELGGIFNIDTHTLCGAQFGGSFNFVGDDAAGAQFSGVNIVGGSMFGAQFSQANIVGRDFKGAQLGMLNLAGQRAFGAQLGLLNIAGEDLSGAQLGLVNIAGGTAAGAQLGLVNFAGGAASGAQLGLVNIAGEQVDGAMIGLVNVAKDADAAIGLVNVIWNGRAQLDAWATDAGLIMIGATQGARITHNTYGIGIKPMADGPAFATAFGIGVRLFAAERLTIDLDVVSYNLFRQDPESSSFDFASIHQLRAPVSFALLRGVWIFVAPSVSVSLAERDSHLFKTNFGLFGSERVSSVDSDVTVRIWPGLSAGLRFF